MAFASASVELVYERTQLVYETVPKLAPEGGGLDYTAKFLSVPLILSNKRSL